VKVVIRQEKKTKFVTPPIHSNTMNNTNNTSGKNNNNNTFNGTFPPLNVKPANLHLLENRKKTLDVSLQDLQKVSQTFSIFCLFSCLNYTHLIGHYHGFVLGR